MPSNRWRPWSQADVALLRRVVNQNPQATNSQTTDLFNAHAQQPRSSSGVSNKVIELELRARLPPRHGIGGRPPAAGKKRRRRRIGVGPDDSDSEDDVRKQQSDESELGSSDLEVFEIERRLRAPRPRLRESSAPSPQEAKPQMPVGVAPPRAPRSPAQPAARPVPAQAAPAPGPDAEYELLRRKRQLVQHLEELVTMEQRLLDRRGP